MPGIHGLLIKTGMTRGPRPLRIQMPGIRVLLIKAGMTRGSRPLRIQMPRSRGMLIKPGMTRTIPLRIQIAGGSRSLRFRGLRLGRGRALTACGAVSWAYPQSQKPDSN